MKEEESSASFRPQDAEVPKEVLELVNRSHAERYRICPITLSNAKNGMRTLTIAMTDPSNLLLLDQMQKLTGCRIAPVQATVQDIMRGIDLHYGPAHLEAPTDLLKEMGNIESPTPAENRSATGAMEAILQRAVNERASDIHIEPHAKKVYVRFRVDGILYDHTTYEISMHAQVISRLKILSNLNIAETRLPQDGRFDMSLANKGFDIRVSVTPATSGEKAVLRILPKSQVATDFAQLGLEGKNYALLEELINKPYGMVLATGPTGSGKTTTIYACLGKMDCVSRNVVTVEDPVEYQFPRVTQIQVHPKIGLTFAAGLRSILRQDPDVIMVGEIRDLETLRMAVQSALTGHLVLSTLHCNDAAAAAARMVDMGAEPFLVASSLNGILAQRLVRRICENCKTEMEVSRLVRQKLDLPDDGAIYYHGTGCQNCRNTGYLGRVSVFEVIPIVDDIKQAIVRKATANEIRSIMSECGFSHLRDDGIDKARAGITSIEEVMRAVYVD